MSASQDEIPPPPPPPPSSSQTPTQQTPHTVSTIKLPILKKGEYDIWAMKMEHYLAHTDYPIWEVIQNGNGPVSITTDTSGQIKVLPPRTAEEIVARERERKARTTLLMALPEDHLAKFHKMTDAKEMWDAIKSRFGGNDESKKMQKYILKQQFEGFSVSNTEGLHKGYDRSENQANHLAGQQEANQNAGTEDIIDAGDSETEDESAQDCFVLPIWPSYSSPITPALKSDDKREGPREEEQVFMDELERLKRQEKEANEEAEALRKKFEHLVIKEGAARPSSTNIFSTVSTPAKASSTNLVNTVSLPVSTASLHEGLSLSDPTNPEEDDSEIPPLEDIYQNSTDGIFTTSSYDDEGAVADFTNLETVVNVSPIPTSRIHSSHPKALILGDPTSAVQTRSKLHKSSGAHAFVSYVQKQRRNNHKDFQHCLFACFLSQHEPKKISEALEDESWVDAMQEELLQFEIQKVWVLVDLPYGKKAIGTKWVYRNKKDERGVVVRNKARLVAQGHRQEEGIDYDEVFAPVARLESQKIFLAFRPHIRALYLSNGCEKCLPVWEKFIKMKVLNHQSVPVQGNQHMEVVNFLVGDSYFGNAKSQPLWLRSTTKAEGLKEFRELLRRVTNGPEALLIPTLFIL
ncbi:putative ribonuclease H-like domain-containing protein [Tanacetum coccineum]